MMWSRHSLVEEPRERRHWRIGLAILAFPAACAIGFGGSALVRTALAPPAVSAPDSPSQTEEQQKPDHHGTEPPAASDEHSNRPRLV